MSDSNTTKPTIRLRSRFPKAQPNIGLSSGINRIRRLSGHYNENEKPEDSEKNDLSQRTRRNSIKFQNADLTESTNHQIPVVEASATVNDEVVKEQTIAEKVVAIVEEVQVEKITSQHEIITSSASQLLFNELQHSYNPRFSKEHIMNIIKHKAMQKLKKIESDSLKEKRRTYKPAIDTENVDRSKLRMRDLLYYNPKNRAKKSPSADNTLSLIDENSNLTAGSIDNTSDTRLSVSSIAAPMREKTPESPAALVAPSYNAPQLKFAEDGSIVLNEESLVVTRPHVEPVFDSTVIENDRNDNLTYNSYRKFHHTKKWSSKETVKFYKALSMIGTDFTMIQKLFPLRNRDEIKRKFKREEKLNQALIDKILSKTVPMDFSVFVPTDTEDEANSSNLNNNNDENSNDTNTTINSNENENNRKNKKPYNRYKPKRTKKRAFIESDDDNPTTTIVSTDNNNNNNNNKLPTSIEAPDAQIANKKQMLNCNNNASTETASQSIIETINKVISNVNENSTSENIGQLERSESLSPSSISSSSSSCLSRSSSVLNSNQEFTVKYSEELEMTAHVQEKNEPTVALPHHEEEGEGMNLKLDVQEDENEDDIEVLIDLDNDYCEIIDNNNPNAGCSGMLENNDQPESIPAVTNNLQNDEEIVILDLDSNQTIIKSSKKEILLQNMPRVTKTISIPTATPTTPIKTASSLVASSSSTLLASPITTFSNSKLIFVQNPSKDEDNKQFQVHMFTAQSSEQHPKPKSNSEITITKISKK